MMADDLDFDLPTGPPFINSLRIDWDDVDDDRRYPYSIPSLKELPRIEFTSPVVFFVGANGSGKSTLLEALAVHQGLNPEGGSQNMTFETRPGTVSELHSDLTVERSGKPRTRFFLRAESYFNVATKLEDYFEGEASELKRTYGGTPHDWSHGESFLKLIQNRFFPGGLFFLDEPEAALSVQGELSMMRLLLDQVRAGSQFFIATHSPILTAFPGAQILQFSDQGISSADWESVDSVSLAKMFLADPQRFLRQLDDEET